MEKSDAVNEVFSALSKAQSQFKKAVLDCYNPFHKSKYASLTAIQESYRDALSANGLAITQLIENEEERYTIITMLGHSSGQWFSSKQKLMLSKDDMQGLGSSVTYARRQSICALLGIVDAEDDGGTKAAVDNSKKASAEHKEKRTDEFAKKWDETKEQRAKTTAKVNLPKEYKNYAPGGGTVSVTTLVKDAEPINNAELLGAAEYKIEFGKDQGKTLAELGKTEVKNKLDYLEKSATPPIGVKMQRFLDYAKLFLNQPAQ